MIITRKKSQNFDLVDKNSWLPFLEYDNYFSKYIKSLEKTDQVETDNLLKRLRMYSLVQLVNYIIKKNEFKNKQDLNFAECGCWKGTSAYLISSMLKGNFEGKFYIFDSFEGLSEFKKKDFIENLNFSNSKMLDNHSRKYFASNESKVKSVLSEFNFINIQKGWIPSKFKNFSDKKFTFVHVDVDLYDPTLECLKFFYPRLEKNGIIVADDYNSTTYPGVKTAWDEFFLDKKKDITFSYESPLGSAFIIK